MGSSSRALAGANLVIGALNLVPGLPLDGGRVLRAAVWGATGTCPRQRRRRMGRPGGGRPAWWLARFHAGYTDTGCDRRLAAGADARGVPVVGSHPGAGECAGAARLPTLKARALARRALGVPHELPSARPYAAPRSSEAGPGGLLRTAGRWASSTRGRCRPRRRTVGLDAGSLARTIEPGMLLPADLVGEACCGRCSARPPRVRPGRAGRLGLRRAGDVRRRPRLRAT